MNLAKNNKNNKCLFNKGNIENCFIINFKTGEIFKTNEVQAFSDFEKISKIYGDKCSLFIQNSKSR